MSIAVRPNAFPWPPVILIASLTAAFALGVYVPLVWVPSPIKELLDVFGVLLIGIALLIEISAMLSLRKPVGHVCELFLRLSLVGSQQAK